MWKSSTLRKWLNYVIVTARISLKLDMEIFDFVVSLGLTKILPIEKCIIFFRHPVSLRINYLVTLICFSLTALSRMLLCINSNRMRNIYTGYNVFKIL